MTTVFVFGSNEAGRHGAGAALEAARNWGALPGVGIGLQGDSYAIPTKDAYLRTLPLEQIARYVDDFVAFARSPIGQRYHFFVTPIGCGLAGYNHERIAPLFREAAPLSNVGLCTRWRRILAERNRP